MKAGSRESSTERAAQRPDRLRQRAVGDDHVRPDAIEDLAPGHRRLAALDQQDQQVEITRDERQAAIAPEQLPLAHRQDEVAEPIPIG